MTDCIAAKARVLAAHADGRLAVELVGQQACPGCRCGRLALAPAKHRAEIRLDAPVRFQVGDEVIMTIPAATVIRGALWLHGLPLIGLLTGAAAAAAAGFGDFGCLAGSLTGFGGALLLLSRIQRRRHSDTTRGMRVAPTA